MPKLPWMKFFPADYLVDTLPLSPASRGIWMDIICLLWRANTRGQLALTNDQWLKYLRCSNTEMVAACLELTLYDICVIQQISHDLTSITSRRMARDEKTRENNRLRQRRHRVTPMSQPDVTPCHKEKLEARSQKLEAEAEKEPNGTRNVKAESRMVLAFLNEKSGHTFRDTDTNLDFIIGRLKTGVDLQTCKSVIARKVRDWKDDPKMARYLRPETLFNRTKFESYLAEVSV